jgi:hypothetical protein
LTENSSALIVDVGGENECIIVNVGICDAVGILNQWNVFNSPGQWQVVPIPASAWLFASALGLLGWIRRKIA